MEGSDWQLTPRTGLFMPFPTGLERLESSEKISIYKKLDDLVFPEVLRC